MYLPYSCIDLEHYARRLLSPSRFTNNINFAYVSHQTGCVDDRYNSCGGINIICIACRC
jgi:hypothetical protein